MLCSPGRGRGLSVVPTCIALHQRNQRALLASHPFTSPDRPPSLHRSLPSIEYTAQRKPLPFLYPHPGPTRHSYPHCAGRRTVARLPQFGWQHSVSSPRRHAPCSDHSAWERIDSTLRGRARLQSFTRCRISCVEVREAWWLQRSPVGWGLSHTLPAFVVKAKFP